MSELEREQLYSFFKENPEKPWHVQDVQKHLGVDDRAWLNRELAALADAGQLIRTRRRTFGLPQEMNLVLGRLQVTAGGYGFVIPDEEGVADLFVPAEDLGGAWDGDKVVARPNPMKKEGDRVSGKVVRILKRKHQQMVGTLEYSRGYAILRPDSPRLRGRILLTPESVGEMEAGSRLVAKIVWPEDSGEREPFGEVAEYLGEGDDPEIETRAVMIKFDLKPEFEPETLAEARAVPPEVTGEMMAGRSDMRGVPTFTIDGEDAKDFDDALSVERLKGKGVTGLLRVGVHIADVSYYVAEGTSLDKEARERATSVYLPGQVLPMLPEELSNGICSLVEGEARLCLSVLIDLTREGEVKGVTFQETVIKSDARLSYEQVQEFADGGRLPQGKRKLERDIKALMQIAQALREARLGSGSLDFNFTEAKVDVDKDGALHLMPIRSNQARQLIEEMMLLANRLVAQDLSQRNIPTLYRVHEDPSEAKFQDLQKALSRLGYTLDLEHTTPADLQTILKQAAGKPEAQLVNTLLLRSLKQARYSADNLGHFGLAFANYLHFTSPIRRYPDLVVHRVLRASLQHRLSPTLRERMKTDFPALAEHASQRERVAEEAERDLSRYFHARWAAEHRGEEFGGHITGVTNFGVFVGLPNAVEGLIHVSNLDDDYYMYLEDAMMLMGKSTRRRFKLGEPLRVRILDANPTIRQIDLLPSYLPFPSEAELEETKREAKAQVQKRPQAKPQAKPQKPQTSKDPRTARAALLTPTSPAPTSPAEARAKATKPEHPVAERGAATPAPPAEPVPSPKRRYKLVFGNSKLEN
ncbi:MAG: ribonuclease R [Deinococcota bacterium]|jgi:ribonuclease R|nr:ribonuclease R [Deinococcota bacterium]